MSTWLSDQLHVGPGVLWAASANIVLLTLALFGFGYHMQLDSDSAGGQLFRTYWKRVLNNYDNCFLVSSSFFVFLLLLYSFEVDYFPSSID